MAAQNQLRRSKRIQAAGASKDQPGDASLTEQAQPKTRTKPPTLRRKRRGKVIPGGLVINPTGIARGRVSKRLPTSLVASNSKGLRNRGQTCYCNAVLQCLVHTPAIYHMLGHTHRDCNDIDQCVVCALQLFTQEYWNPPPAQAGLTNQNFLFSALRTQIPATGQGISSIHSDTTQGDSHEFLQYLVEQVIAKTTPGTFCDRVFRYAQRSTWTCVTCTKVHTRPSVVQNALRPITIQFPRTGLSFKEYLRLSFQNSVPLQCDGAQCVAQRAQNPNYQNPTQTEHFEIEKEPEVLIFQLVRMTLTPNGTTRKIANQVPFEEYLNMGPYIAEQGGERRDVMYRLDGVVAHAGPNLTSGHYIAGVRDADGKKFSLINDQVVSARDVGALERPYWSSNFEPYILIYSKL